jgi:hypothetical protein
LTDTARQRPIRPHESNELHFFIPFLHGSRPALSVAVSLTVWCALACAASPSPGPASPAAAPAAAGTSPVQSASPDGALPRVGPEAEVTLEQLIPLVARPGQWPLDIDAAEQLLQPLGPVRREQPVAEALSLRGGPSGVLNRYEVSYSADEEGHWMFDGASFFLGGADLLRLHDAVAGLLTQQLGKADWTEDDAAGLASAGWALGGAMKLVFSPSPNGGEPLLMISIAEPESESD